MGEYDIITEAEIKNAICALLDKFPERILFTVTPPKRTRYTSKFMRHGWPDVFGVLKEPLVSGLPNPARPFFIEVKKPGGALTIEQHKILERAKALGAITCVATSVDDVRRELGI